MMPLDIRLILGGVLLAAVAVAGWFIYDTIDQRGYDRAMAEVAEAARKDRDQKEADLAGVGVAFAAEAQKERIVEKKIIEKVVEYVPITDPLLSGGFRLLHDAAATGQPLDHTGRIDAAAVTSQDVARTIAENYADCRYEKIRIEKLQDAVRILNGEAAQK